MTPEENRRWIKSAYESMKARAEKKEINHSCIYRIIEGYCRAAALEAWMPWETFMPKELYDEQHHAEIPMRLHGRKDQL